MNDAGIKLKDKTMAFAVRIVNLYKWLCSEKKEFVLSKQLLRSGTSIGANVAESRAAMSRADFLAKIYISAKECREAQYWIELLYKTDYLNETQYNSIKADSEEIGRMLSAITKTMVQGKSASYEKPNDIQTN